jgi:hypothetical protein
MLIGLASVAMAMTACGGGSIGEPEGSSNVSGEDTAGLLLDENSANVTRGRFVTSNGQLTFFSTSDAATRVVRIQINGKTFDVVVDGDVTVDGHDAVLTPAEKALLLTFSEAVTSRFQTVTTAGSRIEGIAMLGSYLSEAPEGYVHRRLVNGVAIPEGAAALSGNGRVICLTTGRTYTASFTSSSGVRTSKSVVAGSNWGTSVCGRGDYNCMGRCGAGCSGTKYTLDCLNHDTCSHEKCSTTGPFDSNCKDEYSAASDDMNGGCTATQ